MNFQKEITKYLEQNLKGRFIKRSFIFGSVAKNILKPNDCDLFIVTNLTPESNNWRDFVSHLNEIKNLFYSNFSLKLNVVVNTQLEFAEESELKNRILKRPLISLNPVF